jgi:SAM-dependent methyltransferase
MRHFAKRVTRKIASKLAKLLLSLVQKDSAQEPYHSIFQEFIEEVGKVESPTIPEIGSRNFTGSPRTSPFSDDAKYTGFDIYEGTNVDVVGDAHYLSKYFDADSFDAVYAVSVFEHLLMPWKVILEANKILKTKGYIFIATHTTWLPHELPGDYWRYMEGAFYALLNKQTGFELINVSEGLPCRTFSLVKDKPTLEIHHFSMNQGVSAFAKKIGPYNEALKWDIDLSEIYGDAYPKPKE